MADIPKGGIMAGFQGVNVALTGTESIDTTADYEPGFGFLLYLTEPTTAGDESTINCQSWNGQTYNFTRSEEGEITGWGTRPLIFRRVNATGTSLASGSLLLAGFP